MNQLNHSLTKPDHYIAGRLIEPLEVIEEWQLGYLLGNVLKYISRAGRKICEKTDLEKALVYLDRFMRNCTVTTSEGYFIKEKRFSIENIAHDWDLDHHLKSALHSLYLATYEIPPSHVEKAMKAINLRLKDLKSQNNAVNENSKAKGKRK
jgi:hypothetical protein